MQQTKIAAQLYTVRAYTQTAEDFKTTIERLKAMGFDAVQISGIGPIAPEYVCDVLEANEMAVCVTHTSPVRMTQQLQAVMREHHLWGCERIGIGGMFEQRATKADVEAFCETYNQVAQALKNEGFTFYYHNHAFEFEKLDGENIFEIIERCTNKNHFKFLVDVFWLQYGGASPTTFIERYKERIDVVHLKDLAIIHGKPMTAELGQGNMDIKAIVAKCEEIGVKWYAIEQDDCLGDPFESLRTSLEYLKGLGIQ